MKFLLSRWLVFAACLLCAQLSYTQSDADTRPQFILKVNSSPLLSIFSERSSAGLGYELRLGDRWTLGGAANIRYNAPFRQNYPHRGSFFVQEIRRYKLHTRMNWFLGFSASMYNSIEKIPVTFNEAGTFYEKEVKHEYRSTGVYAISGIHPQIKSSRFTIDLCAGLGASYVQSHLTNLTDSEMAYLSAISDPFNLNNYNEILDREIGNRFNYSIYFGLYIGYILSR